jgi:hypothetical protein
MKISEAYITFVDLVNRNLTNNNLNVDKPRFINLFNRISIEYVSWLLDKRQDDGIRFIEQLLIMEHPLKVAEIKEDSTSFFLPEDYLDLANFHVYATYKKCKEVRLKTFEIKSEDLEELLNDDSSIPTFDYRETFYLVNSGRVTAYQQDFKIPKATLSYYRYPKKVDISGYIHLDKTNSKDIDPEFDDKVTHRILTAMAKQFASSNGDTTAYQLTKDKLFSEI